jgi:protein CpxP
MSRARILRQNKPKPTQLEEHIMSKKTQFLVLALALFVAVGCLPALAQGGTEPSSQTTAQTGEMHAQVQDFLQKVATELNLTDDQKAKIKPLLQDEYNQLTAVHNDASLSQDQKVAKAKEIHATAKSEIQAILTPEQQTKFAQMKEQLRQSWEGEEPPK